MSNELDLTDVDFILESLKYTKLSFEEYRGYPSYDFKRERIKGVEEVTAKVRALRRDMME